MKVKSHHIMQSHHRLPVHARCAFARIARSPRQRQCLGTTEVHGGPDLPGAFVMATTEHSLLCTLCLLLGLADSTTVLDTAVCLFGTRL